VASYYRNLWYELFFIICILCHRYYTSIHWWVLCKQTCTFTLCNITSVSEDILSTNTALGDVILWKFLTRSSIHFIMWDSNEAEDESLLGYSTVLSCWSRLRRVMPSLPLWWRQYAPLKCLSTPKLRGAISQKGLIFILTSVRIEISHSNEIILICTNLTLVSTVAW
jgi:hypothetical protein